MPEARLGSFDDLLDMTQAELRPIAVGLRNVILAAHPEAVVIVRLGDRAATFGLGPKKMSEGYVYIMPHKSWINLGFYKGAELPDPNGLLEGTGAKLRHIKIREFDLVQSDPVQQLIADAIQERKSALEG